MNNIEIVCFLEGFSIAFSLIISVGPQNTFLIKQGIKREYVFVVATICLLLESCLIVTGVFTAKVIISLLNISINKALLIGAGFLLLFGTISFISIFQKKKIEIQSTIKHNSLTKIIISTFFLSLLNPGIIIESLLIIGSIGSKFSNTTKYYFIIGAITASFIWFFSIGYISYLGAKLFKNTIAWKMLDFTTGCIMYTIAIKIFLKLLNH